MNNEKLLKEVSKIPQIESQLESIEQIKADKTEINETNERLLKTNSNLPKYGQLPSTKKNNIKILSPINGNCKNYKGADGVVSNAVTYEDLLFYKGAKIETNQLITYEMGGTDVVPNGTFFIRFKPIIDLKTGSNIVYPICEMTNSGGQSSMSITLDYTDAQPYKGIEIRLRNGANIQQLIIPNINFNANEIYSIALVWCSDRLTDKGNVACYINGLIQKATNFDATTKTPSGAYKLAIGNYPAFNRPLKAVIESVFFAEEKIETSGILKLHREPLDFSSIYNNKYKEDFKIIGYEREVIECSVIGINGKTLYGINPNNRHILRKSNDEGKTWEIVCSFNEADIIALVEFVGDNVFVAVRSGTNCVLKKTNDFINFTNVLTFATGGYPVGAYNFDVYNGKIIVSEYGDPLPLARVFLSTDGGNTFNIIKTLPINSRHVHSSKFDPYTGDIWVDWGDAIEGTEVSRDNGQTWTMITSDPNHQAWDMVFTKDCVIFGSDTVTSGTTLRIYDKNTNRYALLGNPIFKHLNHIYGIHIDEKGYLWWYGNREAMVGVNSTISISPDLGATVILLEDIGNELISMPYGFYDLGDYLFIGNSKIVKPMINI